MGKKITSKTTNENLETVATDKFEHLSNFIDAAVKEDEDAMSAAWSQYTILKSKEKLGMVQEKAEPKVEDESEENDEDDDKSGGKYAHLLKQRTRRKAPVKKLKKDEMNESALKEFVGDDSPVKLKGDDVFVQGKQVGTLENDMSNIDAGITFTSTDGKVTKEFEDLKGLYEFLVDHFNVDPEGA